MDSSLRSGTPSLSEVPSGGARALWLLWGFSKVTRCKSGTNSRHYLNNGYALSRNHRKNGNQPHPQKCNHHPPPPNPTPKPPPTPPPPTPHPPHPPHPHPPHPHP